jgi:type II secretory pathway pseudopilin PulG
MSESHFGDEGTWQAVREATRSDVQAALAPRRRTCPTCGHVETGPGRLCTNCGGDFVLRRSRRPSRRVTAAVLGVIAAIGLVSALVIPGFRDSAREQERAAAARQARLEAAERARLAADVRPFFAQGPVRRDGEPELAHRARLVTFAEATVTADARRREKAGTVDGPIRATDCYPYPKTAPRRSLEADPSVPAGRYQCMAYNTRFNLPDLQGRKRTGILGVPYWFVVDYGTSKMAFCKITPKAGEGGRSLATVPVPTPCRDPLRTR